MTRLLRRRKAEIADELEQLRAQLAGCGVAAMDGGAAQECKPGDYGYSPAYADVLALRRCMEAVRERIGVTLEDYEAAKYDAHAATLAVLERRLDRGDSAMPALRALVDDCDDTPMRDSEAFAAAKRLLASGGSDA